MTSVDTFPPENTQQAPFVRSGFFWLAGLVLVSIPLFWLGFVSLGRAWITPEYSHGPLIPLISLYLFLRELRDHHPRPAEGALKRGPGLAVMLFAALVAIIGNLAQIPDVVTYGFVIWVSGVVLVFMGWAQGKRHQLPVLHLVFMLPLPQYMYWKMNTFLQGVSSEFGVWVINLFGIPVFLDGNVIDLGPYQLLVAEACSGLRYLFPILSFSYLVAILYRGPYAHKVLIFALAAPLAVLMNSFRIGMIGVLVNYYGIGQAEGFLHYFEGWVIFGTCVAILFLFAMLLQRFTTNPKTLSETVDFDFGGMGPHLGRVFRLRASVVPMVAAVLITAASAVLVPALRPDAPPLVREVFALFPRTIENWRGQTMILDDDVERVLGANDYIMSLYTSPDQREPVEFFSAWYASQTEGQGIHSPEVCLPSGGWEIHSLEKAQVSFPNTVYGSFTVNRAIIEKQTEQQLVYYWFEQRGVRMTNDFAAKLTVLRDGLTKGRTDGGIVRFVTKIGEGETVQEAEQRMQTFMAQALQKLPEYIPE
ncbi:VPLPA-CTERM-specific exosortase XrtD [Celeribacter neptunius]|uniref:Exosortase D, VPLPA-CTERM-specific n=1 Tax=Celeribacter neptunius TaxID=588602 RepID=A0A1I3SE99_9RHOB|nr:VPLPA-CTERM-specific exosortase XrtD [Celeribacter neptunius]SFJ55847.1 exosortase D, VPLPA-CTERM-specific [Celeribacter neptunius]